MKTWATHTDMVSELYKNGAETLKTLTPERVEQWHAATGICGEAGELLDAVKKMVIYNKPLDRVNVVEELGDLEFYMSYLRLRTGITREECLEANMHKLGIRYGSGYSDAAAQARADKNEK